MMKKFRQISLALLLLFPVFLSAQGQANRLSKNGTDPTEPRTRIDINVAEAQFISSGDIFGTRLSADLAFAPWFSAGISLPYYYAALPSATVSGLGDISVGMRGRLFEQKNRTFRALAAGVDISLNNGDPEEGTGLGQYIASPYLAAAFYLADDLLLAPIVQEFYSFGGAEDVLRLNEMSFRVRSVLSTENGHWFALTPEIIIDYEGIYRPRYLIRSSLGYMIDDNWAVSGDFVSHLFGDQRFSSIGRFNIRYLFTIPHL